MRHSKIAKVKTIRSLERGLAVMKILQELGPTNLNRIFQESGLPRPTLLRILRTLESIGLIRKGMGDGLYRNSFRLERMVSGLDESDRLAEIAAPAMDRLCKRISWPSELAVKSKEGPFMVLKETSRPNSPFLLNRDPIGHKVSLTLSAVGRAYLAFCKPKEREFLLAEVSIQNPYEQQLLEKDADFDEILAKVRSKGYATRHTLFGGGHPPIRSEYDDGLEAIAVALSHNGEVLGCISIAWLRKASSIETIACDHLKSLQETATKIAASYKRSLLDFN